MNVKSLLLAIAFTSLLTQNFPTITNAEIFRQPVDSVLKTPKKRIVPRTVTLTGYISDAQGEYNIPCDSFKVSLIESIEQSQTGQNFSFPKETTLDSKPAMPVYDGTCQYKLQFNQPINLKYIVPRTLRVVVKGNSNSYEGTSFVSDTSFPDNHLILNVIVAQPEVPR